MGNAHEQHAARGNILIRNAPYTAIATVTLLVIAAALLLYRQTTATGEAQEWLLHTHQVKETTGTLLARIETGMIATRDYLLEGKEEDLKPYADAFDETLPGNVLAQLATLRSLTADNPVQQRNLDALEPDVKDFQAYLASLIALRKSQNATAPANVDPTRGKQLLDQLRGYVAAMIGEEDRLLATRAEANQSATERANRLIFAALAAFYMTAVLAILLCRKAERRAQAALRDNEQRYALAIQGLSVGLWDWNVPTGEIYWSPRFRQIIGITDENFAPSMDYIEKNLHPDDRESVMRQLNVYAGSGEMPIYQNECRFRCTDGSYVWLYSRGQAICGKDGKVRRMVGCIEDITTRKEVEHAIQQHVDALKRSNQELDDFAYIASHDLKEPLRGLTNNANFMREDLAGNTSPEVAKRLDRMIYLCQRLERLVDDLLYFSRLGRQELAIQKTDLNEVIKDINLTMETTLRDANAVIVTPEALPTIVCDLPRVTEVFRNLIVNGVKYNKNADKRIEIGCVDRAPLPAGNDNSERAFYVRDNGIGIPKEFYNDVFRIFKRLNAEDDGIKGTGVGLTFVRKIIERHGGKIWLDSEVGKGTTFYFTLNTKKEAS